MEGVVASLPLGTLALAAVALLVIGAVAGGLASRARSRRRRAAYQADRARQIATLLNALPQAALVVDANAHTVARNARAAQLLRELGHNDDLPLSVDAAVGRVSRTRLAEVLEIAAPGGSAQRFQVNVSPLLDGESTMSALVLISNLAALVDRSGIHQRLIGTIAHELRTPLTAIMGHVDIIGSCQIGEEALWRRSLGFVSSETERLARLVEDLLNLSRLDTSVPHTRPVGLRAIAEESLSAVFDAAERHGVTLVLQSPADLPQVEADPDRIRQVLLNLLDNAIKYAPDCTVTLRLTSEECAVRVEVSDTGPGVSSEDLPHIFEAFYRGGRAAPNATGTGLGLTIVRAILDQHNASVSVHSLPNQSTTFSFALPIARSA